MHEQILLQSKFESEMNTCEQGHKKKKQYAVLGW